MWTLATSCCTRQLRTPQREAIKGNQTASIHFSPYLSTDYHPKLWLPDEKRQVTLWFLNFWHFKCFVHSWIPDSLERCEGEIWGLYMLFWIRKWKTARGEAVDNLFTPVLWKIVIIFLTMAIYDISDHDHFIISACYLHVNIDFFKLLLFFLIITS